MTSSRKKPTVAVAEEAMRKDGQQMPDGTAQAGGLVKSISSTTTSTDHEQNDSQLQAEAIHENGNQLSSAIRLGIRLPDKSMYHVVVSLNETIVNIYASMVEQPLMMQYSCSQLYHNGIQLSLMSEIGSLNGLSEHPLELKEVNYGERDVRIHILRLRDVLQASSSRVNPSQPFVCAAETCWRKVTGEQYLNFDYHDTDGHGNTTGSSLANASKKQMDTVYDQGNASCTLDNFPCSQISSKKKPQRALVSLSVSGWNPAPSWRRLRGDLLYIRVVFEDKPESHHITATANGFFINSSSDTVFNSACKSKMFHALPALLSHLSPHFVRVFPKLVSISQEAHVNMLENSNIALAQPAWNWLVDISNVENADYVYDGLRGLGSIGGGDNVLETSSLETIRDWNEDLQTLRHAALSHEDDTADSGESGEAAIDIFLRARQYGIVYSQFVNAAITGALAILSGSVLPITSSAELDSADDQLYIWNNILFSLPESYVPKYNQDNHADPCEAARVAAGKDLEGIRRVNTALIADAATMPTVIIDAQGKRFVAQGIIPGIIGNPNGAKVVYGSYEDSEVPIDQLSEHKELRWDAEFHNIMGRIGKRLHWKEHAVTDDKSGNQYDFWASAEVKGIRGFDGRMYLFDLARTSPIDITFLDGLESQAELPIYPHRLTFLRHELVQHFHNARLQKYVGQRYKEERERQKAQQEITTSLVHDGEALDTSAATQDNTNIEQEKHNQEGQEAIDITPFLDEVQTVFNCDIFGQWNVVDTTCNGDSNLANGDVVDSKATQEEQVRLLSAYQHEVAIPELISELSTTLVLPFTGVSFVETLHRRGVNLRHLGAVITATQAAVEIVSANKERLPSTLPRLEAFRQSCLREMVVRALKHIVRRLYTISVDKPTLLSHMLNTYLSLNTALIDEHETYKQKYEGSIPIYPTSLKELTPMTLCSLICFEVAKRFRYILPLGYFASLLFTVNRSAFLREACVRLGIQLRLRHYDLADSAAITSDDVINVVPIVKSAPFRCILAENQSDIADTQARAGQVGAAIATLEHALVLHEQAYTILHRETLRVQHALAELYLHLYVQSDDKLYLNRALDLQRQAVVGFERTTGLDSQETISAYSQLASLESVNGRARLSLRYVKHTSSLQGIAWGPNHPDVFAQLSHVGRLHRMVGRWDMAAQYWEKVKDYAETYLDAEESITAPVYQNLALAVFNAGDYKRGTALEKMAYNLWLQKYGPDDERVKDASIVLSRMVQAAVAIAQRHQVTRAQQDKQVDNEPIMEKEFTQLSSNERPIDELVAYINGTSSLQKKRRSRRR